MDAAQNTNANQVVTGVPVAAERRSGFVIDIKSGGFGFIECKEIPESAVYFRTSEFVGFPPLRPGDRVNFNERRFRDRVQAYEVARQSESGQPPTREELSQQILRYTHPHQLSWWADLGPQQQAISTLKAITLDERWEFKNSAPDPDRPFPILHSYLQHTFGRLAFEKKVMVSSDGRAAAFNTGLVDHRYEAIYALLREGNRPYPWRLDAFCIKGEDCAGQNLVRIFGLHNLPATANYFEDPRDLLYDVSKGAPAPNWDHVVVDNIDRYPSEFVEDYGPAGFRRQEEAKLADKDREAYFAELRAAVRADARAYRRIMSRVKEATELSIKRVAWNFKTAIPTYYPKIKKSQLLLPICLVTDDHVDLALATEKTPSGSYLGHTVLPLDWAYKNARLVCRPDSDWLSPKDIEEKVVGMDDTEETVVGMEGT